MAKAKNTTTQKSVTADKLTDREPKVLAEQAFYAYASLVHEAVEKAQALPATVKEQAPKNLEDLKAQTQKLREDLTARVETFRAEATKQADARLETFGKHFDTRAKDGKKVTDELRGQEPVKAVEEQLKVILDQTANTRSQVKAAVTSVRKTADVAVDAGRKQGKNAQSQVKAAVTSARKTVDTVVESGKKLAS